MIIDLAKEHIVTPASGSSGDDVKDGTQYHTGQELQREMDAALGVVTIEELKSNKQEGRVYRLDRVKHEE